MSARLALLVSLAAIVYTAGNLVDRVRTDETDFSVFHRTALAVTGAGGELYGSRDPATGWFRALPPAGVALFVPLAALDPVRASVLWALANLGLLGVAIVLVRRIRDGLEEEEGEEPFHLGWAVVLLLALAGPSRSDSSASSS